MMMSFTLKMGFLIILLALATSHTSIAASIAATSVGGVEVDRIEETTIYFKAPAGASTPKPLKTELYDLKYLGQVRPSAEAGAENPLPYLFFTARPCKSCPQDSGLYAIRPSGGRPMAFIHPGKIFEPKSRALLLESRAFLGHCLTRSNSQVYVVFQKERIDRKKQLQASVLIAEPGLDHMSENLLERHLPRLQDTLRFVKAKSCQEIEGRNRVTLSRSLSNGSRRSADEPGGSDHDDATKENKTDSDLATPDAHGG